MSYSDEIDQAIAAHGLWKQRLHSAVTKGAHILSLAQVHIDNGCDFGDWFYGLPATLQETEPGPTIQKLHAAFHTESARILILALDGSVAEAEKALEPGSRYAQISEQLMLALAGWKQTIISERP